MARTRTNSEYLDFIAIHLHRRLSNRRLRVLMAESFGKQEESYGPIPSESVIQRETKKLTVQAEAAVSQSLTSQGELDTPWRLRAIDPDGIPTHVSAWIIHNILSNDFIMRNRALHYPKITDHFDAVTRRTARWIFSLFDLLQAEKPLLVWSIAWMYSCHEVARLNGLEEAFGIDGRTFDSYVSYRPWISAESYRRYENAVTEGHIKHIRDNMFGVIHRLQISSLNESIHPKRLQRDQKRFLETVSSEEQDLLLEAYTGSE